MWINFYFSPGDLKRFGITHKQLLDESGLLSTFAAVKPNSTSRLKMVCLQQRAPISYGHRPADEVLKLASSIRDNLWATVASIPPYRRYYVYLSPVDEKPALLPQLLSIYAVTFYLGSITRYRPHHFDKIIDGPFGPRIKEFIGGQALQFIYLMASEFAQQEVTKPSIV